MAERRDQDEEQQEDKARKAILLRLNPDLHADLRAWAAQELRSLNAHIEWLLRDALRKRRAGK